MDEREGWIPVLCPAVERVHAFATTLNRVGVEPLRVGLRGLGISGSFVSLRVLFWNWISIFVLEFLRGRCTIGIPLRRFTLV